MSSIKDSLSEKMGKISSGMAQATQSNDPRPEDVPFDASPGQDEEFGAHAATRNFKSKSDSHAQPEQGAKGSDGDKVEGALLRLVNAS
jgi:hypothetical protein